MPLVQSALKLTQPHHLSSALSCWVCLGAGVFALSATFQASPHSPFLAGVDGPVFSQPPLGQSPHFLHTRVPAWSTSSHGDCLPDYSARPVPLSSQTHRSNGTERCSSCLRSHSVEGPSWSREPKASDCKGCIGGTGMLSPTKQRLAGAWARVVPEWGARPAVQKGAPLPTWGPNPPSPTWRLREPPLLFSHP